MVFTFIQGIAGADGPPGKDGLVGERVRTNYVKMFAFPFTLILYSNAKFASLYCMY